MELVHLLTGPVPFPKTGLRSHRHRQPHGPGALGSQNAMKPRTQCALTHWNPGFTACGSGPGCDLKRTGHAELVVLM